MSDEPRSADPILPGALLGVLGGGQLGRMFAMAARAMGYRIAVLDPVPDAPACQVADRVFAGAYDDQDAVEAFARAVDVVTFEFENVPAATATTAARHAPVRPSGTLLHTTQDRLREKAALRALGLPLPAYAPVTDRDTLAAAADRVPGAGVLKTASWGYDGKGQRRIAGPGDLAAAWTELGEGPCVLEALVPFQAEVSVVGARGLDGDIALFPLFLNDHSHHILDLTTCPAPVEEGTHRAAAGIARSVLEGLGVVGVLCIEMFLLEDGSLLINELAPRPHNSGHLTIEACATSQYEQQVRAVTGLPLGATDLLPGGAAMANLLGDLWEGGTPDWASALSDPLISLHLYGKGDPRPGRKMGHLTAIGPDPVSAAAGAREARARLRASRGA